MIISLDQPEKMLTGDMVKRVSTTKACSLGLGRVDEYEEGWYSGHSDGIVGGEVR